MLIGLPVALLLSAEAAAQPAKECAEQPANTKPNEIIVCAVKPDGYRISPDLMEARRLKKQGNAGPPKSPHETYVDHSCATVGPMGCRGQPTVNLIAVAAVAAQMGQRLAKGQEVGSMFKTTPAQTEYQLYQDARKRREAKEQADAAAKVKAAAEAQAAGKN